MASIGSGTAAIASSQVALALRGALLTPLAAGGTLFEPDAVVLADRSGVIRHSGPARRALYRGPVRDVRPGLILPGFVDAHTHYPQTRIIGCATGPLLEWLETSVFPEEARFRQPRYAREVAREMIDRMIRAGTTTAAVFSSSSARATEALFEQLADRGLRGVVGITWMDRRCPKALAVSSAEAMRQSLRLVRAWHGHDGDRLRFGITPRFALSCSRTMLRAAGRLARDADLLVQTHIAEHPREGSETLRAHPYAKSYLDVYDQAGLIGPRTILAHAIHLSKREWDRVAAKGTRIAHCPDSNFFLGSGRMPIHAARSRGIAIGLGSDVAAGRSFSLRRAMASAYDSALARGAAVEPSELLRMATLGGAEALGMGERVGSIEPGKDADIVVIRLARAVTTAADALARVIFDTDDTSASHVFVRGRRLDS
jgi:guanine deaminase